MASARKRPLKLAEQYLKSPGAHYQLDSIDWEILRYLQEVDSRVSNATLANHIGISAPPCLRRVRSLQEHGIIKGFQVDLDASTVGYGIGLLIKIRLKDRRIEQIAHFEKLAEDNPIVRQCEVIAHEADDHLMSEDILLHVVVRKVEDYHCFVKQLKETENVSWVKKAMVLRRSKMKLGAPIDPSPVRQLPGSR